MRDFWEVLRQKERQATYTVSDNMNRNTQDHVRLVAHTLCNHGVTHPGVRDTAVYRASDNNIRDRSRFEQVKVTPMEIKPEDSWRGFAVRFFTGSPHAPTFWNILAVLA